MAELGERVKYLEDTIRRLLRERTDLEKKNIVLENLINTKKTSSVKYYNDNKSEVIFLDQIGELLRPIVHDIKNQLNFLLNVISELIRKKNEYILQSGEKDFNNSIELVVNTIDIIRAHISSLSYLGGKMPNKYCEFDINAMIKNCVKYFERRYYNNKIECYFEDNKINIEGDEELIWQIVSNLVQNAIEACEYNNGTVKVVTRLDNDTAVIIVEDNGIGILPCDMEKIYDLHFTTKKTGYGIGLYLVKKAINFHQGEIKCDSTIGKGTVFTIRLPIFQEKIND